MKSRTVLILRALRWLIERDVAHADPRADLCIEGRVILKDIVGELELEKEETHAEEVGNCG